MFTVLVSRVFNNIEIQVCAAADNKSFLVTTKRAKLSHKPSLCRNLVGASPDTLRRSKRVPNLGLGPKWDQSQCFRKGP